MSATPTPQPQAVPQALEAPNQINLLWERYRSLFYVVVLGILGAMGVQYYLGVLHQGRVDAEWAAFSQSIGLKAAYGSKEQMESLADSYFAGGVASLKDLDLAKLESSFEAAPAHLKPYYLFAVACKSKVDKDFDKALQTLDKLAAAYPQHVLVKESEYPPQVRQQEPEKDDKKPPTANRKPTLKATVKGSSVQLLRDQIAAAKAFQMPAQFARVEVPADATKYKFETGKGSFVIALMPQAKLHRDAFMKLADSTPAFWEGTAVDEIRRSTKLRKRPMELHFGFDSSRTEDRTQWASKEPSKNQVEFEDANLSHFAGAVCGRPEADGDSGGKSCVDRLWISVDDNAQQDGERVVFGYVVEGLDVLKSICELPMSSTQEDESGEGRPNDLVRITKVTKL
jgi:hypothetical protein